MSHCINIFLGKKEEMNDPLIKYVELKKGIVAILDWPGNRSVDGYDSTKLLAGRTIVDVSTDYFGGFGSQRATLTVDGKVTYEGDSEEGAPEPINNALRRMGVEAESGDDEFDTVGLGHYRSNRDFESELDDEEIVEEENFDEDAFRNKVTRLVSEGGWSSISSLVDRIPIEDLRDMYSHLEDDEDDE